MKQIPYAATEKDIKRHFKAASVRLLRDGETKKSRGQAFVELRSSEEAKAALGLQGSLLQGRPLTVEAVMDKDAARQRGQKRLEEKQKREKDGEGEGGGSSEKAGAGAVEVRNASLKLIAQSGELKGHRVARYSDCFLVLR